MPFSTNTGIPQTNPEGPRAHQLTLKLVGRVKTRVPYSEEGVGPILDGGTTITHHEATYSAVVISRTRELGSFAGRVETGLQTFPFSFALPEGLPPGMKVRLVRKLGFAATRFTYLMLL